MGEFAVAAPDEPGRRQHDADALVLDTISAHADGLLRLARRHSLCQDDAHDAYQRGLEIFLKHAHRLEPEGAASWLRTVVKHEAMAVRRARQRDLGAHEVDFDALEAPAGGSPEDRALGADLVARSAEALQRLKPQELRALWLQAQGNSYAEIEEQTGWSRTKVNRCVYEGRQSFLQRFAGIESGAECERWLPVLSALVDGEATPEQLLEVRPHLRNCSSCRAVVRELHRAGAPLRVVLPVVPLAVLAGPAAPQPTGHGVIRLYETISAWATERAATGILRSQAMIEAIEASTHKAGAVLAASAAVAGGGAVALERHADRTAPPHARPAAAHVAVHRAAARRTPVAVRSKPAAIVVHRPAAARIVTTPATPAAPVEHATTTPSAAAQPAPRPAAPAPSAGTEMGLE